MPVYLQIANAFIMSIRKGHLQAGQQLPGTRELAQILGLHRKTVVAAFNELLAQGWITMIPRKGSFVATSLPEVKALRLKKEETTAAFPDKTIFPIRAIGVDVPAWTDNRTGSKLVIDEGLPDTRLAPVTLLLREMRSLASSGVFRKYYQYGSPRGAEDLCETMAGFLHETRGLPITSDHVMITQGAQMGIFLAGSVLIQPGDHVIVGEPGYFATTHSFRQMGAVINRVPVDEQGMNVDAVEALCRRKKIRVVYVIPHHHYPTTVTLVPERRIRLLQLAAKYRFAIIEDDYDYDFHYNSNPILPLASLDHQGHVIYIGTLTKTLAPAIRVGFLVAPKNFIEAATGVRRFVDRQGDTVLEMAIARLYRNGTIARHIRKSVKVYQERRDHFASLLEQKLGDRISFRIPDGGMSIWTKFHAGLLSSIAARAAQKGLKISDGSIYNTPTRQYNSCRLGFASLDLKEQEKAIGLLASVL